jgi:hypothetical protein
MDQLTQLLRKTLRITVADSREFIGECLLIDYLGNIILGSTNEVNQGMQSTDFQGFTRYVGLVHIPLHVQRRIVLVDMQQHDKQKDSFLDCN